MGGENTHCRTKYTQNHILLIFFSVTAYKRTVIPLTIVRGQYWPQIFVNTFMQG